MGEEAEEEDIEISNLHNNQKKSHENSKKIFIGHGKSNAWKDLKDFLQDRLKLEWDEFNRELTAGRSTKERLEACANFFFCIYCYDCRR